MSKFYKYSIWAFVVFIELQVSFANAQEVKIIKYNDLEEIIASKGDGIKVINFWATWCKPCIEELPAFETISEKYSQKDIKVYLVSMDFVTEVERVNKFVNKRKLKSEVLLLDEPDYNKWINKVNEKWSGAIPATLMIGSKAKDNRFFERTFDLEGLEEEIKKIE